MCTRVIFPDSSRNRRKIPSLPDISRLNPTLCLSSLLLFSWHHLGAQHRHSQGFFLVHLPLSPAHSHSLGKPCRFPGAGSDSAPLQGRSFHRMVWVGRTQPLEWEFPLFHLSKERFDCFPHQGGAVSRGASTSFTLESPSSEPGTDAGIVLEAKQDQPRGNGTNHNPDPTEFWDTLGWKGH